LPVGDEGGFGDVFKHDLESEHPAFNESENILVVVAVDHRQRSCLTGVAGLTGMQPSASKQIPTSFA
jgi:hypothetical protein